MNLNSAPRSRGTDIALLAGLAAVMAATRLHHFAVLPDASWAVFFVAGFYLRRWTAWAFPLLMALVASVALCQLFAQGGFYWMSDAVAQKSLGGWAKNYFDWVGPYLLTTALYVGAAIALHVAAEALAGHRGHAARA